jgi:[ribosomal protein S18]-alanine N-acetyltransferase
MTETPPHAAEATERSDGSEGAPAGQAAAAEDLRALSIRRLAYADLPQVIGIERRAFPTPWSLAMFVLELSKPSGICLAATLEERLVGYLVCSRYDRVWHLMNVAVDLHLRRRGVATAMMRELFERADGGSTQYTLEVRLSNRSAIAMYERFGFRAAGKRRGYYHDNREDALIMWRTIDSDGAATGAR